MTFQGSSINSPPPPPSLHLSIPISLYVFLLLSLSLSLTLTLSLFLFLAAYLSKRHVWNDLLIANIITVLCLHVLVCVQIWARAHTSCCPSARVSACVHAFHITHRGFKYSFYPDVCVRLWYCDNRPFVARGAAVTLFSKEPDQSVIGSTHDDCKQFY